MNHQYLHANTRQSTHLGRLSTPPFTPEQARHVALMRTIAQELTSRTGDLFVLKGGTTLLLAYDLPHFSIVLDFDGRSPAIDLTDSIQDGAAAAQAMSNCG